MSKIIGVTVGTPTSPKKIEEELKPVKTVNGVAPDENGNVEVGGSGGGVLCVTATITGSETADGVQTLTGTVDKTTEEIGIAADAGQSVFLRFSEESLGDWFVLPMILCAPQAVMFGAAMNGVSFGATVVADGSFTMQISQGGGNTATDAVLYTEQSLTMEQQAQARKNIGASGVTSWNDLENKPFEAHYEEVMAEQTLKRNANGYLPGSNNAVLRDVVQDLQVSPLEAGAFYKVVFPETDSHYDSANPEPVYEAKLFNYLNPTYGEQTYVIIGDPKIMKWEFRDGDDDTDFISGFAIATIHSEIDGTSTGFYGVNQFSTVTFSLHKETGVKCIRDSFIPDTIARVTEVERMINDALGQMPKLTLENGVLNIE